MCSRDCEILIRCLSELVSDPIGVRRGSYSASATSDNRSRRLNRAFGTVFLFFGGSPPLKWRPTIRRPYGNGSRRGLARSAFTFSSGIPGSLRRDSEISPSQKSASRAPCFFRSMRTATLRPLPSVTNWTPVMGLFYTPLLAVPCRVQSPRIFAVSEALLYPLLRISALTYCMTSRDSSFKNTKPVHVRRSYANVRDRETASASQ
jgi:hypothetical protein